MAAAGQSIKRVAISKANAQVVAIVGIAAFISVFSLVASHALWVQNAYVLKVSGIQQKAHAQLQNNLKMADDLTGSYQKFISSDKNVIGGQTNGSNDNDGDNAKIVLDALPSTYDFPALTSSIEKILNDRNLKVGSITGTDDELAQQAAAASPNPAPVPMAFSFTVTDTRYDLAQGLMQTLQQSIRPIQVDNLTLTGSTSNMTLSVNAHTFYQPPKTINISSQVVK